MAHYWIWVSAVRRSGRQIRQTILRAEKQCPSSEGQSIESAVPRKTSKLQHITTVPETDTGVQVE